MGWPATTEVLATLSASSIAADESTAETLGSTLENYINTYGIPQLHITAAEVQAAIASGNFASLVPAITLDFSSYISSDITSPIIDTFSLALDQRALMGTKPLGPTGFAFGIDVIAASAPQSFNQAVNSIKGGAKVSESGVSLNTSSSSSTWLPPIPQARLFVFKGITDRLDLGLTLLPNIVKMAKVPDLQLAFLASVELRYLLYQPEEGVQVGFRAAYNLNSIRFGISSTTIALTSHTITPGLLISKPFDFADPYIGISWQYATGSLTMNAQIYDQIVAKISKSSSTTAWNFFGGILLRVPGLNLIIVPEGSYSPSKMHALAVRVGFMF
jgi:hypothetical protein